MAGQGWHLQDVDVKSAFLYEDLEEEIYMTLPEGHWEMDRTALPQIYIYGLKSSG
jgi:hypothetical protein